MLSVFLVSSPVIICVILQMTQLIISTDIFYVVEKYLKFFRLDARYLGRYWINYLRLNWV